MPTIQYVVNLLVASGWTCSIIPPRRRRRYTTINLQPPVALGLAAVAIRVSDYYYLGQWYH